VDDVELKGRNAAALGDLLVHQHSQGPWSHYRLNDVDPNPLDRKRRRVTAGAEAVPGLTLKEASGTLVEEDHEHRRAVDRTVRAQFGDNALPALDNVRIDVRLLPARARPPQQNLHGSLSPSPALVLPLPPVAHNLDRPVDCRRRPVRGPAGR